MSVRGCYLLQVRRIVEPPLFIQYQEFLARACLQKDPNVRYAGVFVVRVLLCAAQSSVWNPENNYRGLLFELHGYRGLVSILIRQRKRFCWNLRQSVLFPYFSYRRHEWCEAGRNNALCLRRNLERNVCLCGLLLEKQTEVRTQSSLSYVTRSGVFQGFRDCAWESKRESAPPYRSLLVTCHTGRGGEEMEREKVSLRCVYQSTVGIRFLSTRGGEGIYWWLEKVM